MDEIRYILASASPRRRELLAKLLTYFEVVPSNASENIAPGTDPVDAAMENAMNKALAVSERYPDAIVIGADTLVVLDGSIIGKPADPEEAVTMLEALSGKTHQVITGIAMVHGALDVKLSNFDFSDVTFRTLDRNDIEAYVNERNPLDMAGGYGIQEVMDTFIEGLDGDFNNVMGLPLDLTAEMLDAMNVVIYRLQE
ncbi:MAG: Maf family protein [Thermoplasmata archaeon]|nr:Maf family protein [Thermoplasmata archaeon]